MHVYRHVYKHGDFADGSLLGLPHEWDLPYPDQPGQRKFQDFIQMIL